MARPAIPLGEPDPRVRYDAFLKLVQALALASRIGAMGRSEIRDTLREWAGVPLRPELDNPGAFSLDFIRDEYPGGFNTTDSLEAE